MPRLTQRLAPVLLALGLLALGACAAKPPPLPPAQSLRDTSRQVYANAGFSLTQLDGTWKQVADLTDHPGCTAGALQVAKGLADWHLCLNGQPRSGQGPVQAAGPGRFLLPGVSLPIWVLWVDADDRTLVLGTPTGAFGLVLDRGTIPSDRAKAVRDILAWNGYNLAMLQGAMR